MAASGDVNNPTYWEGRYRASDMPWDKDAPAPALQDFLLHEKMEGHVLVPGCGLGHDVRAIARTGPIVTGLDFSEAAIRQAQAFPRAGRETYLCEDLFQLPPEYHDAFDWVFEHTCFCAIDPQRRAAYAEAIAACLKCGGKLLAIFFINPDHDEDGPPYGISPGEIATTFRTDFDLLREWNPGHFYAGREDRELLRLYQKKEKSG